MQLLTTLCIVLIGVTFSLGEELQLKLRSEELKDLEGLKKLSNKLPGGAFLTCQLALFSDPVDFNTAEEKCKNLEVGAVHTSNGNMATVNDDNKMRDLKFLLDVAYPLGAQTGNRKGPTRRVWAGLTNNNGGAGKSNKKQMTINHHGDFKQVEISKKHPYACNYQGKYILSSQWKTWREAKVACEDAGLHLAKVRNIEEVKEMKQAMTSFLGKGKSGSRWDTLNWVWLGGNDEKEEGTWVWTDGEPVSWVPWITSAGGDNAVRVTNGLEMDTGQDALAMNRDGLFDDSFIEQKLYPFACQCPNS